MYLILRDFSNTL